MRDGIPYRVYGYKGKQVRDNIHSFDVCTATLAFSEAPRAGAVYNIGGGRANSISLIEAIARLEEVFDRRLDRTYVEEARRGDHVCYISDSTRFRADYPSWEVSIGLDEIVSQLGDLLAPAVTTAAASA